MLRQSVKPFFKKVLPIPPLCESDVREVKVELRDPLTGDVLGHRVEHSSVVSALSEDSFVSNESADLYSIENMQRVGISSVECPRCGYVRNNLDSLSSAESVSEDMLYKTDSVETPVETSVETSVVTPVELSKTE